jgi:hypothetical protein
MKSLALTVALAMLSAPVAAARVEIVLDVSGSMRAAAGDVSRMEAAQRAVRATVEAIDPSSNVALRLYGHRLPAEPKEASCRDTELVIPFGKLDRARFIAAVESAKPLGQTPLAFALEQAAADFGQVGEEAVAIILVSDGEESCGGDPAKVACALRQRGLELTVHTVGFDVNAVARQQLQAVASCTGGEYRDARNAGELAESLRQLTQAGLLVEKQREARTGNKVRGGNGYGSATPITAGTYRLDHHQRPNEYDYFALQVKPGHLIRVTQEAYEVGVTIEGTKITENNYPTVGLALHGPDRVKIVEDAQIQAGSKAQVSASVTSGKGGTYYLLVGQHYWSGWGIHAESPFTIEIIDATDAGSGTDAGEAQTDAVRIQPGSFKGWLQPGDGKDTFWFEATAGTTYQMRARPQGESHATRLRVTDEDGVELASEFAPNAGAAVRLDAIRPTRAGRLLVELTHIAVQNAIAYDLELVGVGGAAAPTTGTAVETTSTAAEGQAERRGIWRFIPGGIYTCVGSIIFVLLVLGSIVALIVFLVRRKK